jgi:drug/metabolite transporter (DMT)-like permease
VILAAFVAAIFFGLSTPLSKILIGEANPFLLAGLLYLGAGTGLIPFVMSGPKNKLPVKSKVNFKYLLIVVGGVLAPVFLLMAIKASSATSISLWLNLELVATAFLGAFFFKDHLHMRGWIGVAISVAAGIILCLGDSGAGIYSGILVALACLCWGFDNHFSALIDNLSPVQSTIIKGFCAGTVNLLIGLILSNWYVDLIVFCILTPRKK